MTDTMMATTRMHPSQPRPHPPRPAPCGGSSARRAGGAGGAGGERGERTRPSCRAIALLLALAGDPHLALADGPALTDPVSGYPIAGDGATGRPPARARAATGDTACWTPGRTPGLFAWRASPGIACRDSAGQAGHAAPRGASGPGAAAQPRATPDPASAPTDDARSGRSQAPEFTFSGNAYVGIAVAF